MVSQAPPHIQTMFNEAKKIDCRFTIHDVRMVPGDMQTNLIFDIVRPYECKICEGQLKKDLSAAIRSRASDINCVITVDTPFV